MVETISPIKNSTDEQTKLRKGLDEKLKGLLFFIVNQGATL